MASKKGNSEILADKLIAVIDDAADNGNLQNVTVAMALDILTTHVITNVCKVENWLDTVDSHASNVKRMLEREAARIAT